MKLSLPIYNIYSDLKEDGTLPKCDENKFWNFQNCIAKSIIN